VLTGGYVSAAFPRVFGAFGERHGGCNGWRFHNKTFTARQLKEDTMGAQQRFRVVVLAGVALALLAGGAGKARADILHSVDDGTSEFTTGFSVTHGSVVFVNRFTAAPGGESIKTISVAYGLPGVGPGNVLAGTPLDVILFQDQTGGATPNHPVLLASAATSVTNPNTNTFIDVPITPTAVTGNFFVGVLVSNLPQGGPFPIAFDRDNPQRASYGAWFTFPIGLGQLSSMSFDPRFTADQNLDVNSNNFVGVIDGNYMIRATGVSLAAVPEPASLTLLATGALGLLGYGWRRRRQVAA
jgi:hypothetical protein